MTLDRRRVVVARSASCSYPAQAPFDPSEAFPELADVPVGDEPNPVYAAVRTCLQRLGLDAERFGTADWNPLGDLVQPGGKVLLKPNLVRHENHGPGGTDCLVTHASVVRPLIDYALLAVGESGEVWIGDSPVQGCDFHEVIEVTGMRPMVDALAERLGREFPLVDFRRVETRENAAGIAGARSELRSDPNGLLAVDLGDDSMLAPLDEGHDRYRVTGYDAEETPQHHRPGKHEFLMSRTALTADLVVNLPKLKSHRKAGMTCALKNLVGLNGDKAWLPHHRAGSVEEGGDEYRHRSGRKALLSQLDYEVDQAGAGARREMLRAIRKAVSVSNRVVPFPDRFREGSWYGNDTIWRTVLDLNRAALYARDGGVFGDERRSWLTVVDAVVCGQNEGPLRPDPVEAGLIVAGVDQALVDLACAKIVGYDPERIPSVREAFRIEKWPLTDHTPDDLIVEPELPSVPLRPSLGWLGHLEADDATHDAPETFVDPYAGAEKEIY